jgi:hypothetical protein
MNETQSYPRGRRFPCTRCRQAKPAVEFDLTVSHSGDTCRCDVCAPCRKQVDDLRKQRVEIMLKEQAATKRKAQSDTRCKTKPARAIVKRSGEISLAC